MSTFLGIAAGISLLLMAIVQQSGLEIFLNIPSIMITVGGTIAAIFISFPLPRVMKVGVASVQVFRRDIEKPLWAIAMIVRLAIKARQQSLVSLERDIEKTKNRFLSMGLEMMIDGSPSESIRDVLETESDFVKIRHRNGVHIFQTAGKFAPAFGLIGTLIGLVAMLKGLGSTSDNAMQQLGIGMAVAMLTTFYGALMANLFFFPLAEKLKSRSDDESLTTRIVIEGVLMVQAGINPRLIEKKLNSFMPPHLRSKHYERAMRRGRVAVAKQKQKAEAPASSDGF